MEGNENKKDEQRAERRESFKLDFSLNPTWPSDGPLSSEQNPIGSIRRPFFEGLAQKRRRRRGVSDEGLAGEVEQPERKHREPFLAVVTCS